jgi:AcrR family transcriptional regulator
LTKQLFVFLIPVQMPEVTALDRAAAAKAALHSAPPKLARRAHSRLPQLLDEAAHAFAERGFAAASVRDIVQRVGMLPGSLYYHFPTKEALLVAVYREGVQRISAAVDAAVAPVAEPWPRLEAACVAHLTALLDQTDYSQVVIRVRPGDAPAVAAELVALRDRYEKRFARLVADLPLARRVRRSDLRLLLMGALNWSQTWYRDDGASSPGQIARRFVALLRSGLVRP